MENGRVNANTVIGIAASVTAIAAVVVSIWQGVQQRRHNVLSVRPALSFDKDVAADGTLLGIDLKNAGTGPALIKRFVIYVDDRPVSDGQGDVWEAAEKVLNLANPQLHFTEFYYDPGDSMPANEEKRIIGIEREDYNKLSDSDKALWKNALSRIRIKVEYTSIYEENFECHSAHSASFSK